MKVKVFFASGQSKDAHLRLSLRGTVIGKCHNFHSHFPIKYIREERLNDHVAVKHYSGRALE